MASTAPDAARQSFRLPPMSALPSVHMITSLVDNEVSLDFIDDENSVIFEVEI